MRSLKLMLKIFVTVAVLVQPFDALANVSKSSNAHKIKSHSHNKKHTQHTPINVWERIRFGMQIPIFSSQSAFKLEPQTPLLSNNATLQQKNSLIKTTVLKPVVDNHEDTKQIKLKAYLPAAVGGTTKKRLSLNLIEKQIVDYANNSQPESAAVGTRIRTRIAFRPQAGQASAPKIDTATIEEKPVTPVVNASDAKTESQAASVAETNTTKAPEISPEELQRLAKQAEVNERINKKIAWYTQHRSYLQQVAERSRPYLYHIVSGLTANHLPTELALLPIVESAYQPTAQSPKSAAGLWQFIPSTGLDFDLTQSDRYDDRLDIDASTQAAIRYLSFLKRHFNGDWLLALAAYNCGLGRVDDAIESNRTNGLPTDYWSLALPEETQDYVPRFLALKSIFSNPTNYGLKLPAVKNEPYFVKVKVNRPFDIDYLAKKQLSTIAELANLSYEQFIQLNPAYLKATPETNEPFTLLMPASNAKQLHEHLNYVELFLAEPKVETTPVQNSTRPDIPKHLPTEITTILPTQLPQFTSPLLSINLNDNPLNNHQTTPRINDQLIFIKS